MKSDLLCFLRDSSQRKSFWKMVVMMFSASTWPTVTFYPTGYFGKKFDFSIDLIDQSKIESINILKSEEAKALYNTSNGVILITTKVSTDNR